jgi:DNA replication protein DnaC
MTHTPEGKALIMSRIPSFGKHARRLVHIVKSRQALVLYGPSGAGKTSTVCALYRWVLDQAMRADATEQMVAEACGAAFVPARDLASARGEYGKEPALVRLAKRASLLVIDDMGAESPGSKQVIEDVVAHRHDHTLVTWVTTGVARDQFQVRYTGGTERRLTESDTWIELSA